MDDESNNKEAIRTGWRLVPGTTLLDGRFEVLTVLHSNGTDFISRCHDNVSQSQVMLKTVLSGRPLGDDELNWMVTRFQTLRTLKHPRMPEFLYIMQDSENGFWLLVTDWREGDPLSSIMQFREDGKLDIRVTLRICRQLAGILDAAHTAGVVFCDIRSENVLVSSDGANVSLMDFGDRETGLPGGRNVSEAEQDGLQSLVFAAPEQWREEKSCPATDQYALAVMAYICLSGHAPFQPHAGRSLRKMTLRDDMPYIDGVSDAANAVLAKAMSKQPERRHGNCKEFINSLDLALESMPMAAAMPLLEVSMPSTSQSDVAMAEIAGHAEPSPKVEKSHVEMAVAAEFEETIPSEEDGFFLPRQENGKDTLKSKSLFHDESEHDKKPDSHAPLKDLISLKDNGGEPVEETQPKAGRKDVFPKWLMIVALIIIVVIVACWRLLT